LSRRGSPLRFIGARKRAGMGVEKITGDYPIFCVNIIFGFYLASFPGFYFNILRSRFGVVAIGVVLRFERNEADTGADNLVRPIHGGLSDCCHVYR
jgi:hypothetical protein